MIWFPTGELKQGEFVIEFEHKQMIVSEMNHIWRTGFCLPLTMSCRQLTAAMKNMFPGSKDLRIDND